MFQRVIKFVGVKKNWRVVKFDRGKDLIKIMLICFYLMSLLERELYFSIPLFTTSVSKLKFKKVKFKQSLGDTLTPEFTDYIL